MPWHSQSISTRRRGWTRWCDLAPLERARSDASGTASSSPWDSIISICRLRALEISERRVQAATTAYISGARAERLDWEMILRLPARPVVGDERILWTVPLNRAVCDGKVRGAGGIWRCWMKFSGGCVAARATCSWRRVAFRTGRGATGRRRGRIGRRSECRCSHGTAPVDRQQGACERVAGP